jgi:transposase
MPRKSPCSIRLSGAERSELESYSRRYTSPYYSVFRAKIILLAAEGIANDEIGTRLSVPRQIVSKWRKRFFEQRTVGLQDEVRSGRPPAFSP